MRSFFQFRWSNHGDDLEFRSVDSKEICSECVVCCHEPWSCQHLWIDVSDTSETFILQFLHFINDCLFKFVSVLPLKCCLESTEFEPERAFRMSVVLPAVVSCLLISSSCSFPVCSLVDVVLEPSESVPALENQESLVVRCSVLSHFLLHNEIL